MRVQGFLVAFAVAGMALGGSASAGPAPDTSISSGPEGPTASKSAKFKFSATVGGAKFQCSLDEASFRACESPKKYKRLKQGAHTFAVRSRKGSAVDESPATRAWTVDTKAPDTEILSGPTGETDDPTPEFTFSSTEAGTFECKFGTGSFEACANPFTPATELPDAAHSLRVRAVDGAGNSDATPASQAFSVERKIALTQGAAEAAAAMYLPDTVDLDVASSCGGAVAIDCLSGTPVPPADQLRLTSSRSVVEAVGQSRYDLTATSDVQTLIAIKMEGLGAQCDLNLESAPGSYPTWAFLVPMQFVVQPGSGEYRIVPGDITVNHLEVDDISITGGFLCDAISWGSAFAVDTIESSLADGLLPALCAAPGPAYMEPCPGP